MFEFCQLFQYNQVQVMAIFTKCCLDLKSDFYTVAAPLRDLACYGEEALASFNSNFFKKIVSRATVYSQNSHCYNLNMSTASSQT